MPTLKQKATRHMRITGVPAEIHRAIIIHQKILSLKSNTDVSVDEAAIDLWRAATKEIIAEVVKP